MGLWDVLTGRSRPVRPNLDALFFVPSAAITLEVSAGFRPTGVGAVCFRAPEGAAWGQVESELRAMLDDDPEVADDVEVVADEHGWTWLVLRRDPGDPDDPDRFDVAGLCTELHHVNTTLVEQGFGHGLLCTTVPFADATGRRFALVYLYKQGTFYAFAPHGTGPGAGRDNLLEIQVRDLLDGELPVERDLQRWLALWGAPGT
jgi:hypothetical protein